MIDHSSLAKAIDDSGIKKNAVAGKLGITPQTFNNKLTGATEFTISEVQQLCEILHLSKNQRQQIFFC